MKSDPSSAGAAGALPWYTALPFAWLGAIIVVAGFLAARFWLPAALILALAVAWIPLRRSHPFWLDFILLLLLCGVAAVGFLGSLPSPSLVLVMMALFSAWDLERFLRRLNADCDVHQPEVLVRLHVLRLLAVNIVGLALPVLALLLRLDLGFSIALLLILIAGISLNIGISHIQRKMD